MCYGRKCNRDKPSYKELWKDERKDMADAFSNMGAFSEAFGMSTLSIATMKGCFAIFLYAYDVFGRVVPDLKDYLYIGPYSYANASEIFTDAAFPAKALVVGIFITACAVVFAFFNYNRRDLAS